ncbi:conserved hypothetical protein [Vibrio nigripulchritudo SOn1]|uniref:Uncharacterized protein n=1 Tax=Vibrio nigripulchritudo SOn1 TaxID=1238450 RepID=A0AAV2VPV1_9VIBR|nr:hypothetical protein [Vibrio nigripulchritudo]CCO46701.1 conserved hypothetical protein [Vibrio nigripulchritudo SOn1]
MSVDELKQYALLILVTFVSGGGFWSVVSKWLDKRVTAKKVDELSIQGAVSVVDLQQKLMEQMKADLDARAEAIEALYIKQLELERNEWERERSLLVDRVSEMAQRLEKLEEINKRLLQENESLMKCDSCTTEAASGP